MKFRSRWSDCEHVIRSLSSPLLYFVICPDPYPESLTGKAKPASCWVTVKSHSGISLIKPCLALWQHRDVKAHFLAASSYVRESHPCYFTLNLKRLWHQILFHHTLPKTYCKCLNNCETPAGKFCVHCPIVSFLAKEHLGLWLETLSVLLFCKQWGKWHLTIK